jgi:CBS domain-containing protein
MSGTVKDVMSANPAMCDPSTTIIEAARIMRDREIGDVLVGKGDHVDGIVTDRDIVVRCLADGRIDVSVADACSPAPATVAADAPIDEAVRLMRDMAIRRLPVTDSGRVVGVVSLGDLAVKEDPKSALADISAAAPNS